MNCYINYLDYLSENLILDEQPPLLQARSDQILGLQKTLSEELGITLPEPYSEFLRRANGYNYNGVFFFTVDPSIDLPDLIGENKSLRLQNPTLHDYLVMGQSGLWYYAFHGPTSTYRALQVDALDEPYYVFQDFDDCISSALEETLELLDEEEEVGQ